MCQPSTTTTFAKRTYRCSAPAVWNSLPKSVVDSDSVTVFQSRLKTSPFSRAFSPKLRSYGAIEIRLLLLLSLGPYYYYKSSNTCEYVVDLLLCRTAQKISSSRVASCLQHSDGISSARCPVTRNWLQGSSAIKQSYWQPHRRARHSQDRAAIIGKESVPKIIYNK